MWQINLTAIYRKKTDIYFLADQQEAPLQIQSFAVEIGRTIPGFGQVNYPSLAIGDGYWYID